MIGSELILNDSSIFSIDTALHCESNKSPFLTHLLLCGSQRSKYCNQISMVDKMIDKKSNFDYWHGAVSNKWGWRVGILYPLLPSTSQYQTQNRQKRNARPRKVLKINIQIWLYSVNVNTKDSPDYFCLWICSTVTFFWPTLPSNVF